MQDRLRHAIDLVTDGDAVDWEGVLENAADERERALIEELRGLSAFDVNDPDPNSQPAEGTVGISAPDSGPSARRWGHLELLDEIGRGSYGTVYRAWDTRLAREVALKILSDDESGSLQEARRLARVTHPNIVAVFGADRVSGHVGLWMELLKGRTLDAIVDDLGPFSAREAVAIAHDICGGVAAIHRSGLVHRDIKAQNVIRERGGRHVLMDLGASTDISQEGIDVGSLAGTPLYMAPELFQGAAASVASDIYAIGVLLYRLVTADFPVRAATIGDLRRAHASASLRPIREARSDLPREFVNAVERCLARDPASRFKNVAALERALHQIAEGDQSRTYRRAVWIGSVATAVAVLLALAAAMWVYRASPRPSGSPQSAIVSADQYKLFAGYEELAFSKRAEDPAGAVAAVEGALSQIRATLTGNHPITALLYAQMADSRRQSGDRLQSAVNARDAEVSALLSVGENHPYSAVVAMQLARNAQAINDHRTAARQILRALEIRSRVLGLSDLGPLPTPLLAVDALEQQSRVVSSEMDSDGDGLLDVIESTLGLDPRVANGHDHLAYSFLGSPFLTWAHYGAHEPRYLAWQSPVRFPMLERGDANPPRWSIEAEHGQGYFTQRLSREQTIRAVERGFSIIVRVMPALGRGFASIVVDASPAGPRFDLMVRRTSDRIIEVSTLTTVVPREGPTIAVEAPLTGAGPLVELRYHPERRSAGLYVNGRQRMDGYAGHRQFQDPLEGAVTWGVGAMGDGEVRTAASFNLVWLEIF